VVRLLNGVPVAELAYAGEARRRRYALRRSLRGVFAQLPVYAIDADGRAAVLTHLTPLQPEGTLAPFAETEWPVPEEARDGWWDGLPYPVYGMRPQGYLGRRLARLEHRELGVPENPEAWSDDDILWVLSRRGSDMPGNLIVGDLAYDRWAHSKLGATDAVRPAALCQ